MKIAIVGSGISGLAVARGLHATHEVTVYEAAGRAGGHAHTHDIAIAGHRYAVDTGFIVYNERTYPRFTRLLGELGVATQASDMGFSVRCDATGLEYSGSSLNALFAQRRNLVSPSFLGMIRDLLRFNREAPRLLERAGDERPLRELLERGGYGRAFIDHYLVPMGSAIWSTDPASMLDFPARFLVRFLHNHGLLTVTDRPAWRTILGGSARYVEKLTAPFRDRLRLSTPVESIRRLPGSVIVKTRASEAERYDAVFLACHSDQALALLADPDAAEREVLGAIRYQRNDAVLHTDARLLPRRRRAWAAWNYRIPRGGSGPATLTYHMNILQRIQSPVPLLVTLNAADAIDPGLVQRRMTYHHPLFTPAAVRAQARQRELNGVRATYYCGAWWQNGFHEDGIASAHQALMHFEEDRAQRALHRSA